MEKQKLATKIIKNLSTKNLCEIATNLIGSGAENYRELINEIAKRPDFAV